MRLIDADALINELDKMISSALLADTQIHYALVRELVAQQPTIEPEVRHGRMIEGRYPNENKCSECGQEFRDDICFIYPYDENSVCKTPKRCPECGCYWDGGADNG